MRPHLTSLRPYGIDKYDNKQRKKRAHGNTVGWHIRGDTCVSAVRGRVLRACVSPWEVRRLMWSRGGLFPWAPLRSGPRRLVIGWAGKRWLDLRTICTTFAPDFVPPQQSGGTSGIWAFMCDQGHWTCLR